MTTINPSTPFFKWKMAIVTKSTDDWTLWNCDETYERTLFIGIHDDLEQPYAALYIIYKGTVQPAAGNAIIADLASMQLQINTALQELQALIDQVNATSASMQELWQKVNNLVVEMEDKLEAMQEQIAKARVWAEGTDAEVNELGGQHSARTWAGIAKQAADLATGAAFPILEDGDQGKALVVNDTADGYVVQTIITETDTTKDYTWTGTNEYTKELWAQGGLNVVKGFNATSASSVLLPKEYTYNDDNTCHDYEAVNVKNLRAEISTAIATCEPLNEGVNLLPAASTWAFWQENDSSVTTLDKTTGIVSGCTTDAYPISAKTLTELGVPEDTKDAEIIMRFKVISDSAETTLVRFWNPPSETYMHHIGYVYKGVVKIHGYYGRVYGGSSDDYPYNGPIPANAWGFVKVKLVDGVATVSYLADASGSYSLATLPDSGWVDLEGSDAPYDGIPSTQVFVGRKYTGSAGALEIDLLNTKLSFGNVTVWDGSTVASAPFDGIFTAVGSVTLNNTTGIASNFGNGSYLQFVNGTPSADDGYDMIFRVMQNGSSGRGAIFSFESGPREFGLQDTQPYFNGGTYTLAAVSPTPAANAWMWVRYISEGGVTKAYVLEDPDSAYTLDTLPELSSWKQNGDGGTVVYSAGNCYIGRSTDDASYYFHGSIDLFNTRITVGSINVEGRHTVFYDGAPLAPKDYQTLGTHSQSTGRIANSVILRRFEADSKVYMELDGTFEGTVASDSTITISTKDYGFKGTLISLQAMQMGTGATTVNYNSTTAADLVKGTLTLRTSLGAGEAYKVSVHCVIEQNG